MCQICISRWWIPNYRWRIWKLRWGSWDPAGSPNLTPGLKPILVGCESALLGGLALLASGRRWAHSQQTPSRSDRRSTGRAQRRQRPVPAYHAEIIVSALPVWTGPERNYYYYYFVVRCCMLLLLCVVVVVRCLLLFLPRETAMLTRSWDRNFVRLSVCLSVYMSHACLWRNYRTRCGYFNTPWKGNHSSFLVPTDIGGWCPLPPENCA